ncbi:MAG: hypothetical protein WCR97_03645 [Bacilli bacterium]
MIKTKYFLILTLLSCIGCSSNAKETILINYSIENTSNYNYEISTYNGTVINCFDVNQVDQIPTIINNQTKYSLEKNTLKKEEISFDLSKVLLIRPFIKIDNNFSFAHNDYFNISQNSINRLKSEIAYPDIGSDYGIIISYYISFNNNKSDTVIYKI